jgi:hypothetical protein
MASAEERVNYLELDDRRLLAQCDVHIYKSSGPGGQHRNKVSSAVRLKHQPTGIGAHGDDSRSQHENKALALKRLRMNIACQLRRTLDLEKHQWPEVVRGCVFAPRGGPGEGGHRLQVGRRDHRFWPVAAFLLDLLEACQGRLSQAAANLGITTSNLASVFQDDHHLLTAANAIRKRHGEGPIR